MKRMAVHNGIFHADDVFGVALMQSIYNDLEIIRTRDEELLKTCDIVSDVGNGKYDHHHVDKIRRENGIPYCGFGLLPSKSNFYTLLLIKNSISTFQ